MKKFQDKVVVITGGNSGIGYAAAKEFISEGAKVIITGRRKDALDKAAQELGATGLLADQGSVRDITALAESVKELHGRVDTLFINAGVAFMGPIEHATEEQFDAMTDINFKGSFFTLQKFIPLLNDGASVIFLSTNATAINMPGTGIYATGKSAVTHLARIAAKELAPRKIRVNTVSPGPTETEIMSKSGLDADTLAAMTEGIKSQVLLGRMGNPGEIAKLVASLADDSVSSFITGTDIFIDGGLAL